MKQFSNVPIDHLSEEQQKTHSKGMGSLYPIILLPAFKTCQIGAIIAQCKGVSKALVKEKDMTDLSRRDLDLEAHFCTVQN